MKLKNSLLISAGLELVIDSQRKQNDYCIYLITRSIICAECKNITKQKVTWKAPRTPSEAFMYLQLIFYIGHCSVVLRQCSEVLRCSGDSGPMVRVLLKNDLGKKKKLLFFFKCLLVSLNCYFFIVRNCAFFCLAIEVKSVETNTFDGYKFTLPNPEENIVLPDNLFERSTGNGNAIIFFLLRVS